MRTIKFRVWDARYKRMYSWDEMCDPLHRRQSWLYVEQPFRTLMQFTGLLDADWREIFEGDVVKSQRQSHEIGKVIFERGAFWVDGQPPTPLHFLVTHGFNVNILGSIYEHPHLLETVDV